MNDVNIWLLTFETKRGTLLARITEANLDKSSRHRQRLQGFAAAYRTAVTACQLYCRMATLQLGIDLARIQARAFRSGETTTCGDMFLRVLRG